VGDERSIVHDEPGTTRDAVDTVVEIDGKTYRFVDTAGLRRAARIDESTEFFGSVRTMRAVERADVVVLVIDATQGIARQDQRLAEHIADLGRSAIVVLNKVDALEGEELEQRRDDARRKLPHLRWAPLLTMSALTGRNIKTLTKAIDPILETRTTRIPTPLLNAVIEDMQARTPIPSSGKGTRVKYAVQVEVAPPTIILFGASRIPEQWLRYIERGLRRKFGFEGTPILFTTRARDRKSMARKRPPR
jgi:GTPase